jgi:hypothetical protein
MLLQVSLLFVLLTCPLVHGRKLDEGTLTRACRLGQLGGEDENQLNSDWFCELNAEDAGGMQGIILPIEGLELTEEQEAQALSTETLINPAGYYVANGVIIVPEGVDIELLDPEGDFPSRASPLGEQSVLVIRVSAGDKEPSSSPEKLSDEVFGTSGDPFNMLTQFDACSYGKFTISPFNGNINGVAIEDGVYEILIDDPNSSIAGVYEREVTEQLIEELGATWRTDAGIDLVMYCLPITGFTAYAYVPGYLSVYSDTWCTAPSGHMHEIGHVSLQLTETAPSVLHFQ